MAEKPGEEQRKAALRDLKQRQRVDAEARMPLSRPELRDLFDRLDEKLEDSPCDHTRARTRTFLAERGLSEEQILPWLEEYGGYCDCEVLMNVEGEWGDRLAQGSWLPDRVQATTGRTFASASGPTTVPRA